MRRILSSFVPNSSKLNSPLLLTKKSNFIQFRNLKLSTQQQNLPKLSPKTIKKDEDNDELNSGDYQDQIYDKDYLNLEEEFGFNQESLLVLQSEGFLPPSSESLSRSYEDQLDDYIDSNYDYSNIDVNSVRSNNNNNLEEDNFWDDIVSTQDNTSTNKLKPIKPKAKRTTKKSIASESITESSRPTPSIQSSVPYSPIPFNTSSDSTLFPLIQPYRPNLTPSLTFPQPHEYPLRSRYDWRLSCPIHYTLPTNLFDLPSEEELIRKGHNRLIGVGPDSARESRRYRGTKDECWSYKTQVPKKEGKTLWGSADAYIEKQTRLLDLTSAADEITYLTSLAKSGTPVERAAKGLTIPSVIGQWSGNQVLIDQALEVIRLRTKRLQAGLEQERFSGLEEGEEDEVEITTAISIWEIEDGKLIMQEDYPAFVEGAVLRFTKINKKKSSSSPQSKSIIGEYHQGTFLEIKNGKLLVAFEGGNMFDIEGYYRIDIGRDMASLELQALALQNLYYDPYLQRLHNLSEIEKVQNNFVTDTINRIEQVDAPQVEGWTLRGTDIREIIIPDLEMDANYYNPVTTQTRQSTPSPTSSFWDDEEPLSSNSFTTSTDSSLPSLLAPPPIIVQEQISQNKSNIFSENQFMNSWIKRYRRENPLVIPGDPDIGLNESQTRAIAMSLDESISLVQGPPGTGKSQTIISLIDLLKGHFRHPAPILLAAPTHVSVDHLLSLLVGAGLNPLRTGKAFKVREELRGWTVERRREEHPLWIRTEGAREIAEESRVEWTGFRDTSLLGLSPKELVQLKEDTVKAAVKYRKKLNQYKFLEHRLYSSLLATADVFVSTALGAGKSKIMNFVDFPIVFIDEAAMCTEPVTLIPLMKGAQHVTLIGDHMQLPAVMTSKQAKVERLHVSLFERLMDSKKVNTLLLSTQYRMRPSISEFPNRAFYLSALTDGSTVLSRPPPPLSKYFNTLPNESIHTPNIFINHNNKESISNNSTINKGEVNIIVDIVGDLLKKNPKLHARDIGIITFYSAQTKLLTNTFRYDASSILYALLGPDRSNTLPEVEINTVDGFQGREKSIIILSTVRSNTGGWIGFLNDKRRLNVALTRAKNGLIVVGNKRTLKVATESKSYKIEKDRDVDSDLWRRYFNWAEEKGLVRDWEGRKEVEYQ